MNDINLSIVVLVYNTEQYLEQCFDSLVNQTLDNIEIIAVDDGSTDRSLEICRRYQEQYSNFSVITQENKGGAVAGTNGMKKARGKYVALVDSDDFLPLDAYKTLFEQAEKNKAEISIGRPLRYFGDEYHEVILPEERAVWEEDRVIHSYRELRTLFHDKFYWNKIFLKSFIDRFEIYMPSGYLYADFLMTFKAYKYARTIAITHKVTYFWRRQVANSASSDIVSIDNLKERTKSLLYLDKLCQDTSELQVKADEIKMLLLSYLITHVVKSTRFRDIFFEEANQVLKTIENMTVCDIHPYTKLRLWMIQSRHYCELCYLVGRNPPMQIKIEGGRAYCNLPIDDLQDIKINRALLEYKRFRQEMIKSFLYIDRGSFFYIQVLIRGASSLDIGNYSIYFKDRWGETYFRYKLQSIGDYYCCSVPKKDLFSINTRLYVGIGNGDHIVFRIKPANCEPSIDVRKKIQYIVRFSSIKKELFFQKRDLIKTLKNLIKKFI